MAGVAKRSGVRLKVLRSNNILARDNVDVLSENVRFMINGLERRQKRAFALDIGVHPTTISKWLAGKIRPENPSQTAICRYFGFKAGVDLKVDPLFLSYSPVTITQRKRWLHEKIDGMTSKDLGDLFLALEKLLYSNTG